MLWHQIQTHEEFWLSPRACHRPGIFTVVVTVRPHHVKAECPSFHSQQCGGTGSCSHVQGDASDAFRNLVPHVISVIIMNLMADEDIFGVRFRLSSQNMAS